MINFQELGVRPLKGLDTKGILYSHDINLVEFEGELWVLKQINESKTNGDKNPRDALVVELFSQNFYRLLLANQPEYRYLRVVDPETQGYYLLSEYQSSFGVIPERMGDKFENGRFKGLGQIVLIAMFLEETDLKNGNIGIVPQADGRANLVKLDGDYALASFRPYRQVQEEMISSEKIDLLPFPQQCSSYNWLDLIKNYISYVSSKIINPGLNKHSLIREEINETILKILMLTPAILESFVDAIVQSAFEFNKQELLNYIISRQESLLLASLSNSSFLSYLVSEKANQLIAQFTSYLQTYIQNKERIFSFEIDLTTRLENLRVFSQIYTETSQDVALQNRQFKAYLTKQTKIGLSQNFEPHLLIEAIGQYASWHHEFQEYVSIHAPMFNLELMQALYERSSKDCLLHLPANYFEKILRSQSQRYIEVLFHQGDSGVATELNARFEKTGTIAELINLYADVLHVIKQSSNLSRLMDKHLKTLECSKEEEMRCRSFLTSVYFQSRLDFRKGLSDEGVFAHYLRELLLHVINEIKQSEGDKVYVEIMAQVDHHAEDTIDDDISILHDLLEFKSKLTSPCVQGLKRHLSYPKNLELLNDYESLSLSERMELFNKVYEDGFESFISNYHQLSSLPRGPIA